MLRISELYCSHTSWFQLFVMFTLEGFIARVLVGCVEGVTGNKNVHESFGLPIQTHFFNSAAGIINYVWVVPMYHSLNLVVTKKTAYQISAS